ncbi:Vegetative incompatibility protein HET-E-1 [Ceratobasidium sp. AG-Ba]|nr:Vegetative incompatibility protein HET-E-1 [Ceratobasidium sp. AG-Ba]
MSSKPKHFKRVRRFFHDVFSDEHNERDTPITSRSVTPPQLPNSDPNLVGSGSGPPTFSPLPSTLSPPSASALPSTSPQNTSPTAVDLQATNYTATAQNVQPTATSVNESNEYQGWTGLLLFAKALNKTSGIFGQLKQAADILVDFIGAYEIAAKNRFEFQQLKTELDGLFRDLSKHMETATPPALNASIQNLVQGIKRETDIIETVQQRNLADRYLRAEQDDEEVLRCYRRIEGLLKRLNLNANIGTWKTLDELTTETYIKGLPHSDAAYYQSAQSKRLNRAGCTENTRIDVLRELHDWTSGVSPERIYWLNGMAGTGKTTIAYSLCHKLEEEQTLAASFFCSRQLPECRDVNRIAPTIAYQLARYSIPFRHAIAPLLKSDPDVYNKPIATQFRELIAKPVGEVKESLPDHLTIVIDALDECDAESGTVDIIKVLLAEAPNLPLRFFVSSRPEHEILDRMRQTQGDRVNTEMRLHELASNVVQTDIRTYLRTEFQSHISVSELQMDTLVRRSGVLFIYAATAVRYISGRNYAWGATRLAEVLSVSVGNPNESTGGIDALYTAILNAAYDDECLTKSNRAQMILVLHTVVCAREPLSKSTMARLLKLHSEQTVEAVLSPLMSVLQVSDKTGVITTLHESFPDFLLESSRSGRFHCNAAEHNARLAELCFRQIGKQVPINICSLESSYVFDKEVPDLSEKIGKAIPLELFYACRYWDAHVMSTNANESIAGLLSRFLSERLLFWMEIMNLKKAFAHGIRMLYDMKTWSENVYLIDSESKGLLHDGWRFMNTYCSTPVLLSTPHIYMTALSFWPYENPIGRCYHSKGSGIIGAKTTAIDRRGVTLMLAILAGDSAECVVYSPDTKQIAVALRNHAVVIWDASTGQQVGQPLRGHTGPVKSVSYSHDSVYIVSGSVDNTIRIWDSYTGKGVGQPLQGHAGSVNSAVYSHDSAYIVSSSEDKTVRLWDAHTGKQVGQPLQGHTGPVNSAVYSHDSTYIVSGSYDKTVRIWDAHTGKQVGQPLQGHTGSVYSVRYSHDDAYIVSGSGDTTVRIWDAYTGKQVGQPLQGHTGSVASAVYSHDSTYIVSGSVDNTVRIWDAHTGKQVGQALKGHTWWVNSVAYSRDSAYIVSGSWDKTVRIWDARTGNQVGQPLQGHTGPVNSVAYSHNGAYIVSGSQDSSMHIWDAHTGQQVGQALQGHTGPVKSVAYSHDSAYIVSGSDDNTVRIWDAHTGNQVGQPLQGHTGWVTSVAYSHNGAYIVSGSVDNTVRIWDARTGKQVSQSLQGYSGSVYSAVYSQDSAYIVSGSVDNAVRVWDAHTGKQVGQPLQGHTNSISSLAYSHDSAYFVSGSVDNTVRIWDAHTGKQVGQALQGHAGWVNSVAYSHDSAYIVSGSNDKTVRIWDAHTGKQVGQPLQGHTGPVRSVAYSHDSAHIVSCSDDNTVRIWDAHTCKQVDQPLQGRTEPVHSVAYSQGKRHIINIPEDHMRSNSGVYNPNGMCLLIRIAQFS